MRLRRADVLLISVGRSRQAVSRDDAVGVSICDQGRVAAGRLWRSSGMAQERAHHGFTSSKSPVNTPTGCTPQSFMAGMANRVCSNVEPANSPSQIDDKRHTTL
jgi:hypothetical protein